MKKSLYFFLAVALVIANFIVFSCNRSDVSPSIEHTSATKTQATPEASTKIESDSQTAAKLLAETEISETTKLDSEETEAEEKKAAEEKELEEKKEAEEAAKKKKAKAASAKKAEEAKKAAAKKKAKAAKPKPAAKLKFASDTQEFGYIYTGDKVTKQFSFTNTGSAPLIFHDSEVSCGCTVPTLPTSPIMPGATGTIKIDYDSTGKIGSQNKKITLITNASPSRHYIYMKGVVTTPPKEEAQAATGINVSGDVLKTLENQVKESTPTGTMEDVKDIIPSGTKETSGDEKKGKLFKRNKN